MAAVNESIYLAGPMTGREYLNYHTFNAVAAWARALGRTVVSPAELGLAPDTPWEDCMRLATRSLSRCSEILMLPGWEKSRGSLKEMDLAQTYGMPISILTFDTVAKSLDDGLPRKLVIATLVSLMRAELLAGNIVELCQHKIHPAKTTDSEIFWGVNPYGNDFIAPLSKGLQDFAEIGIFISALLDTDTCYGQCPENLWRADAPLPHKR
ncbi:DUF4406 domain-containing protein [Castellaniella sp.]|uniref:DUF4406 domain-containing protein n=1 Tax=Castellaniella sp. TaxID=1955812 RepID=UPI002B003BA7|nr:DUF4406 domain-containing protein [Castellaniella sp.]